MKYRKFHKDMEWMMFVKSMLIEWFYLLEALHSTVLLGNCCVLIWPHATRGISGYLVLVLLIRRAQMGKWDLQVLIPNYLASPSNCVQPAGILAAQDAPAQKWMPILRRCFIDVPSWSKLCFNWFVLFVSPVIHMYALLTGKFGEQTLKANFMILQLARWAVNGFWLLQNSWIVRLKRLKCIGWLDARINTVDCRWSSMFHTGQQCDKNFDMRHAEIWSKCLFNY